MVTCGDDCTVRLTVEGTGELFAECPVPKEQPLSTVCRCALYTAS